MDALRKSMPSVNCQAVNSSKNELVFTTMLRVFVRFMEEIEDTKHFEINWPLSKICDEQSKKAIKDLLVQNDRTLLVDSQIKCCKMARRAKTQFDYAQTSRFNTGKGFPPFQDLRFWQESFRQGCFNTERFRHVQYSVLRTFRQIEVETSICRNIRRAK